MSLQETCAERATVDRHFAGKLSPEQEQRMRRHLPDCETCREHYENHMLLASIDPKAKSMEERLARGLGLGGGGDRSASRRGWIAAAATATVAAACLVLAVQMSGPGEEDRFQPRGEDRAKAELLAYRLKPGQKPAPVKDAISRKDELAFAYRNSSGKKYLMVFAVDEGGAVYWFHPAWTNPKENPTALPISSDGQLHELKEAVGHEYKGNTLKLYGLFLDSSMRIRQVEAALQRKGNDALNIPGAIIKTSRLKVKK